MLLRSTTPVDKCFHIKKSSVIWLSTGTFKFQDVEYNASKLKIKNVADGMYFLKLNQDGLFC